VDNEGDEKYLKKVEYDYHIRVNPPSSIRLESDEEPYPGYTEASMALFKVAHPHLEVKAGSLLYIQFQRKLEDVSYRGSYLCLDAYKESGGWYRVRNIGMETGLGTKDWEKVSFVFSVPSGVTSIRGACFGGGGDPVGITWFDDLKIYQDGVLIYETKFSNWAPFIAIPAPIVAGLGVVWFGKKG
jgi:hypothetical protein